MKEKRTKCDHCGKFIGHAELINGGGASWLFVPDTQVTHEEIRFRCKLCTGLYGKPHSSQLSYAY